jgi:hypothetical protein
LSSSEPENGGVKANELERKLHFRPLIPLFEKRGQGRFSGRVHRKTRKIPLFPPFSKGKDKLAAAIELMSVASFSFLPL